MLLCFPLKENEFMGGQKEARNRKKELGERENGFPTSNLF